MERVASVFGYDIYELSKEECRKNGRVYPTFCVFPDNWDEEEDGERQVNLSETEEVNLTEAKCWCSYYRRN